MCGRYSLGVDFKVLIRHFNLKNGNLEYSPHYNIAPGQDIPVIASYGTLSKMRWGLIPRWVREIANFKIINARAETIDKKPAFRDSFKKRRCLIPADGFYEWKNMNGRKKPIRITLPDKSVFSFAGIWDCWISPEGNKIYSCSIITTKPNNFMEYIHDRMPVIFTTEREYDFWLNSKDDSGLKKLLRPYEGKMKAYYVSEKVNNVRNDDVSLILEQTKFDF